jgi:hypothetical protein
MTSLWGRVVGIWTGTDWTFYPQENATLNTNIVTKKGVIAQYFARPHVFPQDPSGLRRSGRHEDESSSQNRLTRPGNGAFRTAGSVGSPKTEAADPLSRGICRFQSC